MRRGSDRPTISATLAVVWDAAVRRLLDLAVTDEGPPPVPFAWLALGSHARREPMLSSDMDSAIAWIGDDADPRTRQYVQRVATRVVEALERGGIAPCARGATAAHPAFARSLASWQSEVARWQEDPAMEQALMLSSVVAEARPVWGMHAGAPLMAAFRDVRSKQMLLRGLARLALTHRPPMGFLRDLVVEHSGAHAGRLDLKHGGLLPIVDLARYAGLAAGVTSASTRERLRAAASAGTLPTADARTLEAAFDLLTDLKLDHQVGAGAGGGAAGRLPRSGHARPAHAELPARRLPRRREGAAADRGGRRPRPAMRFELPRPLIQRPRSAAARRYRREARANEVRPWRAASFAVVDLETTGLDARRHEIISWAVIHVDDGRIPAGAAHYGLVRPHRMPEQGSIVVHGILPSDIATAPSPEIAFDQILAAVTGRVVVAHAAWFEKAFLARAAARRGVRWRSPMIDTSVIGRWWLFERDGYLPRAISLASLTRALGLPRHRPHHARATR